MDRSTTVTEVRIFIGMIQYDRNLQLVANNITIAATAILMHGLGYFFKPQNKVQDQAFNSTRKIKSQHTNSYQNSDVKNSDVYLLASKYYDIVSFHTQRFTKLPKNESQGDQSFLSGK